MANELLQGLLDSLMQRPEDQAQKQGAVLANLMGQPNPLASTAAFLLPGTMANVGSAARGLFGLSQAATPEQKLQQLVASNPDMLNSSGGLVQLARLASASGNSAEAARLALMASQKKQEEDKLALDKRVVESQIASNETQIKVALANARTPEERDAAIAAANALSAQRAAEVANMPEELKIRALEADNRKAALEAQIEQNKLAREGLDVATRKVMNDAEQQALGEFNRAENLKRVADAYDANKPTAGLIGGVESKVKSFFGSQGGEDQIRTEFNQVVQSGVLSSLPPGAASDRDIMEARKGWPSEYSDADTVAKFLRGMAKLSAISSEQAAEKAKYIADTKNLTGFTSHWRDITKQPSFADDIASKYGLTWDMPIVLTDQQAADLRAKAPPPSTSKFTGRGDR